jgi:hypothetical protein
MLFTLRRVAVLLTVLRSASTPNAADAITGTYDVSGTVHVSVSPFPAQDSPGKLTATLSRSAAPGAFSLRLEARGYACTLPVRATTDGVLQFPDRPTCPLDVSEPDARGHLDVQLRTARAQAKKEQLELALEFDVTGSIQLRIPPKTIRVFGSEMHTPATWAPGAPVHGTVAASGQGSRQAATAR